MAITNDGRDFINNLLKVAAPAEARTASVGMKTTSVLGFPLFLCWGRWGGAELNSSGNNKAFLFLPYQQAGQLDLLKFDNTSSIESPLNMVASGAVNPYNCKVSVTPSLNISHLITGEFYFYVLSLKPAAVSSGGNTTPYWDGWLKAAGDSPNEISKDYFAQFALTKSHWKRMKKSTPSYDEIEEEHQDAVSNGQ